MKNHDVNLILFLTNGKNVHVEILKEELEPFAYDIEEAIQEEARWFRFTDYVCSATLDKYKIHEINPMNILGIGYGQKGGNNG